MDYRDTPDEAAFRERLRSWIAEHAPAELPHDPDERVEVLNQWHRAMYRAGWVGLTFPVEYGGHGMSPVYEAILNDELGAAGAPPPPAIGHITNAIRLFGSDAQKREHLPGLLSSTVRWCQGFSEPNAGSDLAGIRTRAVLQPATADAPAVYRIDGQKIWTSEAVWSQWCLLLARTEADQPAHRALSMLFVPLSTPGMECREIITAYGTREFAEVFFDGAEVPAENVLGKPGDGWTIAMQLLGYERGPADVGWVARLTRMLTVLEEDVRAGRVPAGPSERRAIAHAWTELRALQLHVQRTLSSRLDGSTPGPEGSIDKLLVTRAEQLLNHVNLAVRGAAPILHDGDEIEAYFWSRAQSIFGGTQQIQRNIVAQRVLGLPRR
jgi:alkylation response protein AidB-like acyl-CoA dehydrogenase